MTIPSAERRIRAALPFIRFMQNFMPPALSNRLNRIGVSRVKLDSDVVRQAVNADDVACEWLIPPNNLMDKVLLYIHGGGFVFGQTPLHLQMGAYLAKKLGFRILMVDYRTAPDHPFPAALDDCVTACLWLQKQGISADNMVIAGDSAGGNLTLTTLLKLQLAGHPLPAAAVCLSPVTDLTPEAQRRAEFQDILLPPKAIEFYNRAYLGDNDPHNPLISPILGDLAGLPPMLLFAGDDELLREDAIYFAEKAESAGVDIRLEIYPRMWHVWQLFLTFPEATRSLDDFVQFCKRQLNMN